MLLNDERILARFLSLKWSLNNCIKYNLSQLMETVGLFLDMHSIVLTIFISDKVSRDANIRISSTIVL